MTTVLPIVGANYRPPAAELLRVLAVGTPLTLRPEPANPAGSNAKAVWVKTADISNEAFVALDGGRLNKFNMTITDLAEREEWHLGYIPAIVASDPRLVAIKSEIIGKFRLSPTHSIPQIELG